ncbi:hypothetical protein BKA58DRAFT_388109 [Alternaria rosae]|uniref:uncharacterized protein n=1 Tax=Alternaria rosae TaxID=1187941 RepID=UPI001E8DAE2E|nr:uncharacterized protein BKA58DRAFT_388109 [Alternaria rosae]KAH6866511.1 hypothetical protein BKA58DRAFT_388109 [Alternaria rosae]
MTCICGYWGGKFVPFRTVFCIMLLACLSVCCSGMTALPALDLCVWVCGNRWGYYGKLGSDGWGCDFSELRPEMRGFLGLALGVILILRT